MSSKTVHTHKKMYGDLLILDLNIQKLLNFITLSLDVEFTTKEGQNITLIHGTMT